MSDFNRKICKIIFSICINAVYILFVFLLEQEYQTGDKLFVGNFIIIAYVLNSSLIGLNNYLFKPKEVYNKEQNNDKPKEVYNNKKNNDISITYIGTLNKSDFNKIDKYTNNIIKNNPNKNININIKVESH